MNCDIKTVIAILYKQLVSSSVNTYQALVDMLFKSYFNDPTSPEYDRSEPSKLNKGTRTLSSNITDFYVRKDKSVLLGDIKGVLSQAKPKNLTLKTQKSGEMFHLSETPHRFYHVLKQLLQCYFNTVIISLTSHFNTL